MFRILIIFVFLLMFRTLVVVLYLFLVSCLLFLNYYYYYYFISFFFLIGLKARILVQLGLGTQPKPWQAQHQANAGPRPTALSPQRSSLRPGVLARSFAGLVFSFPARAPGLLAIFAFVQACAPHLAGFFLFLARVERLARWSPFLRDDVVPTTVLALLSPSSVGLVR